MAHTLLKLPVIIAILAACLPGLAARSYGQGTSSFQIAKLDDPKNGLCPTEIIYADASKETLDTENNLVRPKESAVPEADGALAWRSGGASIRAAIDSASGRVDIAIKNDDFRELVRLDVRLPAIVINSDDLDWHVLTGSRGGEDRQLGSGPGNSGGWPGYCFSPVVSLYHRKTNETLGLTWFDPDLFQTSCYWFTGVTGKKIWFNPFLRLETAIPAGGSTVLSFSIKPYQSAQAQCHAYRSDTLLPFLQSRLGPTFKPRAFKADGAWGTNNWTRSLLGDVTRAANDGLTGYMQWSPADASSLYYNPDTSSLPWARDFKTATSLKGMKHVGVLINPFISPNIRSGPMFADGKYAYTNLNVNARAPNVRQYHKRLIKWMKEQGITVAFWDTGSGIMSSTGTLMRGVDYLQILKDFADADITVMPENGGDVAALISGAWLQYPEQGNTPTIARWVNPEGQPFVLEPPDRKIERSAWTSAAQARGFCPILDLSRPDARR